MLNLESILEICCDSLIGSIVPEVFMVLTDGVLASFLLSILDLDFVIASCHRKMVTSNLSSTRM